MKESIIKLVSYCIPQPSSLHFRMLTLNSILKSLNRFVNEEFECPICLELCSDTHLSPDCGHRFCGKCIRESIRKCNHECPTCRVPMATHRSCRRDPQFDRMVSKLLLGQTRHQTTSKSAISNTSSYDAI